MTTTASPRPVTITTIEQLRAAAETAGIDLVGPGDLDARDDARLELVAPPGYHFAFSDGKGHAGHRTGYTYKPGTKRSAILALAKRLGLGLRYCTCQRCTDEVHELESVAVPASVRIDDLRRRLLAARSVVADQVDRWLTTLDALAAAGDPHDHTVYRHQRTVTEFERLVIKAREEARHA